MNWQRVYAEIIGEFVKPYKKDPNVIGITVNGGISRGTGDEFSEIDLHFYVKNIKDLNLPKKWPKMRNDIGINGVWFDIYLKNYKEYLKRDLGMAERWDLSNCKILFDRGNKIKGLIKNKAKWKNGEREKLLEEDLGIEKFWSFSLARTFVVRKDIINAHMLINRSLDLFVDYFFVKNNEFIPHFKWKYYYFQRLKKIPNQIKKAIINSYKIKEYTLKDFNRRISLMNKVLIKNINEPIEKQNQNAVKKFIDNLRKRVVYHHPFDHKKIEEFAKK